MPLACPPVDSEVADRGRSRPAPYRPGGLADEAQVRLDAGDQLSETKRLDDIVDGAEVEADDDVGLLAAGVSMMIGTVGCRRATCRQTSSPSPSGRPRSTARGRASPRRGRRVRRRPCRQRRRCPRVTAAHGRGWKRSAGVFHHQHGRGHRCQTTPAEAETAAPRRERPVRRPVLEWVRGFWCYRRIRSSSGSGASHIRSETRELRRCIPTSAVSRTGLRSPFFDGRGGTQTPRPVAEAVAATLCGPLSNRGTSTESATRRPPSSDSAGRSPICSVSRRTGSCTDGARRTEYHRTHTR